MATGLTAQQEVTVTEYDRPTGQMHDMSQAGLEQCLEKMAAALTGSVNSTGR